MKSHCRPDRFSVAIACGRQRARRCSKGSSMVGSKAFGSSDRCAVPSTSTSLWRPAGGPFSWSGWKLGRKPASLANAPALQRLRMMMAFKRRSMLPPRKNPFSGHMLPAVRRQGMSRWSLQPSACLPHPLSVSAGPEWWLEDFRKRVMDEIATIVAAGAVLGALAGWIGPGRWRWQLLRLAPLLLVPFALYILATRSWILG